MPLTPPFNFVQKSSKQVEPTSELHNLPSGLGDRGGGSGLFTRQRILSNLTDPTCPRPPLHDPPALTGPNLPSWKRLICGPPATHERIALIPIILSNQDEVEMVRNLCNDDAQSFIDVIHEARSYTLYLRRMSSLTPTLRLEPVIQTLDDLDPPLRKKCVRFLYNLCDHYALLPKSLDIQVSIDQTEPPLCHGGFAEVWKGKFHDKEIAIKRLRVYQSSNHEKIRRVGG